MKTFKQQKPSPAKTAILLALLFLISTSTSLILSSYPQHVLLDNATKIGDVKFTDGAVIIKGNQKPIGTGDVIPLEGREYIKIQANQKQLFGRFYTEGIRTVVPQIKQNILFQQPLGEFDTNKIIQVGANNIVFNFIPINEAVYNVNTFTGSNSESYNIQFTQGIVYVNFQDIMLKLEQKGNKIKINLIGVKPTKVWIKVL